MLCVVLNFGGSEIDAMEWLLLMHCVNEWNGKEIKKNEIGFKHSAGATFLCCIVST